MEGSLSCDKAVACEMGKRDPSLLGVGLPCQSALLRAVICTCSIHASFTKPFCAQITWVWLHVPEILKHSGKSSESLDMHAFWRLFCGLFSSLLRRKLQQTTLKPLDSPVPNDRVTVSLCLWKDNTYFHQPWTAKKKKKKEHRGKKYSTGRKLQTWFFFFFHFILLVKCLKAKLQGC